MQEYRNVVIQGNNINGETPGSVTQGMSDKNETMILLNKVKSNPDIALSTINNMKIKVEMEKKAIESKIAEMEEELSKINNPTIQDLLKSIKESTNHEQLENSKKVLQELENRVLSEIELLLKNDAELLTTLNGQYGV